MATRTLIPAWVFEEEPPEWQEKLLELQILKALAPEWVPQLDDLTKQRLKRLKQGGEDADRRA